MEKIILMGALILGFGMFGKASDFENWFHRKGCRPGTGCPAGCRDAAEAPKTVPALGPAF
jgi:hypothetical protein